MSFILDALKKSEAERQRQTGPTLLELRVTQPRRRYPGWVIAVALLLAVNAGILLYVVVRRPPAPAVATVSSPAPTAAPAPPAVASSAVTSSAAGSSPATAVAAPAITAVAPLVPASSAATPGTAPPATPAAPAAPATGSVAASVAANPVDDEPAVPATSAAARPAPMSPADYAALPNLSSLGNNVPALQLDLLDYSDLADERYALINMHRVREGDVLPEGPRVLAITRDGVAMAYNGQDFMLRSSGSGPP